MLSHYKHKVVRLCLIINYKKRMGRKKWQKYIFIQ